MLENAYNMARELKLTERHSASYLNSSSTPTTAGEQLECKIDDEKSAVTASIHSGKFYFCGRGYLQRKRRQTEKCKKFIASEICKLLAEGIIEPTNSPWRSQASVVEVEHHKIRMIIVYSQTIHQFTLLVAFFLPKI